MAEPRPSKLNARVWRRGAFVRQYAGTELRPVEALLLDRYGDRLTGRVLELGSGAGRVTAHLTEIASEVHGIELAPVMVAHAERAVPRAIFHVGDMTDLTGFESGYFGAVLASYNVLDVLDDAERGEELDRLHDLIAPGGLLIMSTHNRGSLPVAGPRVRTTSLRGLVADLARLPRRLRNRHRLRPLERERPGYAIVNDSGHDYALVHYYITRDDQERQLALHGFELIECLDLKGRAVGPGQEKPQATELHYVARRT